MLKLLFDWAGKMSQASRVTTGSGKQAQKAARGARGCPTSGAGPGLTPTEGSLSATHRPLATQGGTLKRLRGPQTSITAGLAVSLKSKL